MPRRASAKASRTSPFPRPRWPCPAAGSPARTSGTATSLRAGPCSLIRGARSAPMKSVSSAQTQPRPAEIASPADRCRFHAADSRPQAAACRARRGRTALTPRATNRVPELRRVVGHARELDALLDSLYLQPEKIGVSLPASEHRARDLNSLLKVATGIGGIRDQDSLQWQLLGFIFEVVPASAALFCSASIRTSSLQGGLGPAARSRPCGSGQPHRGTACAG